MLLLAAVGGGRRTVLWGAAAQGSRAYLLPLPLPTSRPFAVGFGLHLDVPASVLSSGTTAAIHCLSSADATLEPPFGAGGFELGPGVDVSLWFDLTGGRLRKR